MNPNAQAAKANGAADEEAKKPSRVPSKGVLKKRATNWQDFHDKGKKKGIIKKDSQFRTSTDAGSRGKHRLKFTVHLTATNYRQLASRAPARA
jgi:survival-of-motor-neuron-related-splicing factor 30